MRLFSAPGVRLTRYSHPGVCTSGICTGPRRSKFFARWAGVKQKRY